MTTTGDPIAWSCQTLELEVPEVMFLVDRSKSMSTESIVGLAHWAVTDIVVATLLQQFGGKFHNLVDTGLLSFPRPGIDWGDYPTYCDVGELPELTPMTGLGVLGSLGMPPEGGATPLRPALEVAYDALDAGEHTRNAVVVFTDGAPNCGEDHDPAEGEEAFSIGDMTVTETVMDARDNGLPTFFVGIGTNKNTGEYESGVEAEDWDSHGALTSLAYAGGTDKVLGNAYYLIDSAESIDELMFRLSRSLYCDVRLPHDAINWAGELPIEFRFDDFLWPGVNDCTASDGVSISSHEDGIHLSFCGAACDDLADFAGSVDVCVLES